MSDKEHAEVQAERDALRAENERLCELLSRLYTWDQMDAPGSDGPYWRSLIEEALAKPKRIHD